MMLNWSFWVIFIPSFLSVAKTICIVTMQSMTFTNYDLQNHIPLISGKIIFRLKYYTFQSNVTFETSIFIHVFITVHNCNIIYFLKIIHIWQIMYVLSSLFKSCHLFCSFCSFFRKRGPNMKTNQTSNKKKLFLTDITHSWASAGPKRIIRRLWHSPMVIMLLVISWQTL